MSDKLKAEIFDLMMMQDLYRRKIGELEKVRIEKMKELIKLKGGEDGSIPAGSRETA